MSSHRRPIVLFAGAALAASGLALPAQGSTDPTTLAIQGTVKVVVIDNVGPGAHADYLHTVVTDDGAEIPVELDDDAPANGRFRGEVVIAGGVASALRSKDLLPRSGATIDEDTRAGRVAVAAADDQTKPLTVASSTIAPVTAAAATTPSEHRAFVAVVDNRGSVEESDQEIADRVKEITDYWVAESDGVITSFDIVGSVTRYDSTVAGGLETNCGMDDDPYAVWNEALDLFPDLSTEEDSGDHLIVAMADECGAGAPIGNGTAGVALVGTDFSSGGPMSFSMGDVATQVGIHEVGHTFGLGHSNLQRCAGCGIEEYDGLYSPMAAAVHGGFDAPALDSAFRVRLGVAGLDEVPLLAAGNAPSAHPVHLSPRDGMGGVRGLDVVDPVSGRHYFVDHRSGTSRDLNAFYKSSSLGSVGTGIIFRPGVTITTPGEKESLTVLSPTQTAAAFGAGQVFTSPTGATTITVTAVAGAGGADVTVSFNPPAPPVQPAPLKKFSAKTPKITGTARVGKTLKVKVGSWSPRPSYRYQWYANGKKITKKGAKSSFKLTSKQKGKRITVRVTGTKSGYATVTKASRPTKKVAKKR